MCSLISHSILCLRFLCRSFCLNTKGTVIAFSNNPKYWERNTFANSVDPDQMPQNAASDQGLHCLSYIQQYFRYINRL